MTDSKPETELPTAADESRSEGEESAEAERQRKLEALRQYSVDPVPSEVRRRWIEAKQPLAPPERFLDTLPPNKEGLSSAPHDAAAAATSSTAPTVILTRTWKKRRANVVAAVIATTAMVIAVIALLKWTSGPPADPAAGTATSSDTGPIGISAPKPTASETTGGDAPHAPAAQPAVSIPAPFVEPTLRHPGRPDEAVPITTSAPPRVPASAASAARPPVGAAPSPKTSPSAVGSGRTPRVFDPGSVWNSD